jgi:YgiT-type zinc finger domain-containing protein
MTGEHADYRPCPLCGGRLEPGRATVPFLLPHTVILIKDVPAEICSSCHEPYMTGEVTDHILERLRVFRALSAEVLLLSYSDMQPAPVPAEGGTG